MLCFDGFTVHVEEELAGSLEEPVVGRLGWWGEVAGRGEGERDGGREGRREGKEKDVWVRLRKRRKRDGGRRERKKTGVRLSCRSASDVMYN